MLLRSLLVPFFCLSLVAHAQQTEKSSEIILSAKKVHEECMDMTPGQTLKYRFVASAELDFNLHYHSGNEVTYAVNGKYSNYSNSYEAKAPNGFCLMWENKSSAPIKLQTTYQIETPA
jgi:hypothetical protein